MAGKLEAEVNVAIQEVENEIMADVTDGFKQGLRYLETNSPIFSGWYQRNHRVALNHDDVDLGPSQKPDDENSRRGDGELAVNNLAKREEDTLQRAGLGDTIFIGNAVEYAQIIEEEGTSRNPSGGWYSKASLVISENIGDNT